MNSIPLDPQLRRRVEVLRRQTTEPKVFARLCGLLWLDDGETQAQVASRFGVTERQVRKWVRLFRQGGLEALTTLHYQGDPGNLTPGQVQRLRAEIQTGRFHNARQVQDWIEQTFQVHYSNSGVRDLLH